MIVHRLVRAPRAVQAAVLALATLAAPLPAPAAARPTAVETAVARSEIESLLAFALLDFDNKDFGRFSALFAPAGRFTVEDPPAPPVVLAPKDMPAAFAAREAEPPGAVKHVLSGVYITLTDLRHARLRGYYAGLARSAAGPPEGRDLGAFDSRLVKIGGRWLFEDYHVIHRGPVPLDD